MSQYLAPQTASGNTAVDHRYASAISHEGSHAPQVMSLRDMLRLLERHKLLIIAIVGLTTLAVAAQQLLAPSQYRSVAQVQVELVDEVGTNQADVNSRNEQRVANAVRLYRSRASAERVIDDLSLLEDEAFLNELGSLPEGRTAQMQAATNLLLSMMSVASEPGSDLIQVAVTTRYPALSARIANQFPESVRDVRNSHSNQRREELLASLKSEQASRAADAENAARELSDFRARTGMLVGAGSQEDLQQINRIAVEAASASASSSGSASRSAGISNAARLRSTAQATSAAVQQLERQQSELIAEQARLGATYGPNHPDVQRVNSQLSSVNSALTGEQARARAAANEVASADAARMTALARSDAAMDAARASRLQGTLASMTAKAYQNNANMAELSQLERASVLADTAYAKIADRIEQIEAQMQLQGVNTLVVSPAVPDFDRISPEPLKMILLAILGSGVIAMLIAFARDLIDDRLRTAAQIRRFVNVPTLGMLPTIQSGVSDKIDENLVLRNPQSLYGEAARSAYAELKALSPNSDSQSVLITSPLPGDGKSTVSLTMAAAAVSMGQTAVVVDLDLRRHGLLQTLQNELDTPDIVDVITGRADLDALLSNPAPDMIEWHRKGDESEEEKPRIVLLSANRPVSDPASILTSYRLTMLIEKLSQMFDKVIINAPAALAVRDARAMCDYTDNTVVVAHWGQTTVDQMKATLELLGDQVNGVVYNHVDYAEHARRKYGDSVQFYMEASEYYVDDVPEKISFLDQVRRVFRRTPRAA
ncbi:GumC family protein [Qipengyuania gelatinilytica]|uniref:Succinoglycan biosynthesis protein exop n=1 Tax=Qipengyuania gelatinilytica TaxID=2867231 RepID=A0ABX9A8Z5_9SPHN|nr:polysaccharide biosynthesis tyrosine autokinase [Qipengyuania gelatinilytica]QZD95733.1 succinoglycan biosynthesis protein exop [Qipengyuania gelatinilytica]